MGVNQLCNGSLIITIVMIIIIVVIIIITISVSKDEEQYFFGINLRRGVDHCNGSTRPIIVLCLHF